MPPRGYWEYSNKLVSSSPETYTKTLLEEWVRDFGEFIGVDNTFKTQEAIKRKRNL